MIVGLVKPNAGNIYLDDLNITDFLCIKEPNKELGI